MLLVPPCAGLPRRDLRERATRAGERLGAALSLQWSVRVRPAHSAGEDRGRSLRPGHCPGRSPHARHRETALSFESTVDVGTNDLKPSHRPPTGQLCDGVRVRRVCRTRSATLAGWCSPNRLRSGCRRLASAHETDNRPRTGQRTSEPCPADQSPEPVTVESTTIDPRAREIGAGQTVPVHGDLLARPGLWRVARSRRRAPACRWSG